MSSALEAKAIKIRAERDTGRTANDFGVTKITVGTTHGQTTLTRVDHSGRLVSIKFIGSAEGDLCHIAFSKTTGREVSTAAAAGNANVGWPITHGETVVRLVPEWAISESMFLIHEASAAGSLYFAISDG